MSDRVIDIPQSGVLRDSETGEPLGTHASVDGDIHLGTAMIQSVYADDNNSSAADLNAANSYTFTGAATSTLGVVGLQWSLVTDQNATVYIDQSPDKINWDITDSFDYIESHGGDGNTVQALNSYWRIRVILTGTTDTTYFRLQGVLCPIADPLPRSLSGDGRLKSEVTITGKENDDRHVWVAPSNALVVVELVRMVGTTFDGTAKDANFWTEAVTGSGVVSQGGEIELATNPVGATANSAASYASVRKARFVGGAALKFIGLFKFVTAGTTNNIRRCGPYMTTDGFFFELDGSTFSVGARRASSDTLVTSGNFNGHYGDTWAPTAGSYYKMEIEWTPAGVYYYINGILLHKTVGGHLTNFLTLPIKFENVNSGGITTNVVFDCITTVIVRLGELKTNPTYKYIAGETTTVCKYGAGSLHTIVNNDNSGSVIVYDNTAGTGTIIASVDLAKVLGTLTFNAPFSNGLTLVTSGSNAKVTVTYE